MRTWLIRTLGGIPKEEVLTTAVKELFNTIGEDDILKEDSAGVWIIGGKTVADATKRLMISEAKTFLSTMLWRCLQIDVKFRANRMMYERAKSETDLIAGKLWLQTLACFKTRLESLSGGSGHFNDDALKKG